MGERKQIRGACGRQLAGSLGSCWGLVTNQTVRRGAHQPPTSGEGEKGLGKCYGYLLFQKMPYSSIKPKIGESVWCAVEEGSPGGLQKKALL